MPMIGGGEPKYSVPEISYSDLSAAPAPRMFPVPLKPVIGTAMDLNLTVGAAEATPTKAERAKPRTARQVDALRIGTFSPLLMDRSASIRVAPEPCGPATSRSPLSPGNSGEISEPNIICPGRRVQVGWLCCEDPEGFWTPPEAIVLPAWPCMSLRSRLT